MVANKPPPPRFFFTTAIKVSPGFFSGEKKSFLLQNKIKERNPSLFTLTPHLTQAHNQNGNWRLGPRWRRNFRGRRPQREREKPCCVFITHPPLPKPPLLQRIINTTHTWRDDQVASKRTSHRPSSLANLMDLTRRQRPNESPTASIDQFLYSIDQSTFSFVRLTT